MPFEWIAAVRFLREGRMQSLFIIVAAAIGVAVIVFMSALLTGMQGNLFRRVLSSQPHIVLERPQEAARPLRQPEHGQAGAAILQVPSPRPDVIDQWQKVRDEVRLRSDILAVAPTVSGPAFVVRGASSQSVSVTGIDPEQYARIVPLPEKIVAGSYRMTTTDVLIGQTLASDLGLRLGDKLRLQAAAGRAVTLNISGIVDLGSRGANQRAIYVLLATAQNLLGLTGGVSSINLTVPDPFDAEIIARSVANQTGLEALSWIASNNQFFLGLNAQKITSQAIRVFVGLSVAAGIASVLVVSVVQRSKEIGILRAMGGSRGQVMRVFLLQGAIVGLLGSVAGSAMATLLVAAWRMLARNPDGTPMFALQISPGLYLLTALLATLTGLVAAVTPALRAARMLPVEAIRG
ncbi:ABC transporter permease [Pseudoduganella sp. GCM10020061]|uniref:ABC transporter permease n=1 Tax=Pseudoduganella sp. GCM10020061 TaxID=3317345 RepID=UPI00363E3CDB